MSRFSQHVDDNERQTDYEEVQSDRETATMHTLYAFVFISIVLLSGMLFFGSLHPEQLLLVLVPTMLIVIIFLPLLCMPIPGRAHVSNDVSNAV